MLPDAAPYGLRATLHLSACRSGLQTWFLGLLCVVGQGGRALYAAGYLFFAVLPARGPPVQPLALHTGALCTLRASTSRRALSCRASVVRAWQALVSVHADAQELKSPASQSSRRPALAYSQVQPPEPLCRLTSYSLINT